MLSETFLAQLVEVILTRSAFSGVEGRWIQAVGLTGSHARGSATPYSDVDIHVFVPAEDIPAYEVYALRRFEDHLLSISIVTMADKRAELTRPESAIRTVPGLRQMRVLYEAEAGVLQGLVQAAHDFRWEPLQPAANAFASRHLCGLAEEAHKALSGLSRDDDSTTLYATYGLVLGLSDVIAVAHGLLQATENMAFQQVMDFMGGHSTWTYAFRTAAGFDPQASVASRGRAGVALYTQTARHLHAIIEPQHQDVINKAVELIDAFIRTETNS
ncbi:MAG: nucleotidyltransferase domain-containing protein [Chloroflexi bacterium]|nr:nucleotidyltransferase domain-containing protein [Chloroflexota bacterium]MCC6892715.1 nucleotidyltransferase domain-containing protein [Anaerolineae bacterium]